MKNAHDFDVIVVGGGLVGCAFALNLAQMRRNTKIALLERQAYVSPVISQNGFDSRIYAISPNNVDYLVALGINQSDARVATIKAMEIYADNGGRLDFHHTLAHKSYLAKTFEASNLQQQLYQKLTEYDNVTLVYDELNAIKQHDSYAQLVGHNASYTCKLVVGSDGANSFVRESMDIKTESIKYSQYGVVANFSCELPHNNVAYQWFGAYDEALDDGVLAYLPLPGNNISIVWSTCAYKELLQSTDEDFARLVAYAGHRQLGELTLLGARAAFPLQLQLPEATYARRTVLIGDAAHTVHPLAGLGVNLGFLDAKLLVKLLVECQNYQLGDSALLAKFSTLRLSQVRRTQLTCHSLQRLFMSKNSVLQSTRNHGFNLLNRLPLIKKYLIKQALAY